MPGNDRNCTSVPAALSRSALSFPKWCPTTTSASPCAMSTLVALLAADTTDVALRSGRYVERAARGPTCREGRGEGRGEVVSTRVAFQAAEKMVGLSRWENHVIGEYRDGKIM
eukprot:360539-Chlamydomonas_euryale.AAC.2